MLNISDVKFCATLFISILLSTILQKQEAEGNFVYWYTWIQLWIIILIKLIWQNIRTNAIVQQTDKLIYTDSTWYIISWSM